MDGSPPHFPPRRLTERIAELGCGSGPWQRADLEDLWGVSVANKVIQDAKAYGWLVSPSRNVFHVPALRDLAVLPWLPPTMRDELLIGRVLERENVTAWCLSAWAREQGIEFGAALFVTDLSDRNERLARSRATDSRSLPAPTPFSGIVERNRGLAQRLKRPPFEEHLLLVPEVPLPTEDARVETLRVHRPATAAARKAESILRARTAPAPAAAASPEDDTLTYDGHASVTDPAWILSLLNALDLPRIAERQLDMLKEMLDAAGPKGGRELLRRYEAWTAYFGRAAPISAWKTAFASGHFPYLFVPPVLWEQMVGVPAARRHAEAVGPEADDAA